MTNLMLRSATGRYRQASKVEVLEVAAQYLASALQRRVAQPLTSPTAVKQFLVQALSPRAAQPIAQDIPAAGAAVLPSHPCANCRTVRGLHLVRFRVYRDRYCNSACCNVMTSHDGSDLTPVRPEPLRGPCVARAFPGNFFRT
jgi:hypothetical protein